MTTATTPKEPTMAERQFVSALIAQADEFEKGLNQIVQAACDMGMEPTAIVVGLTGSMIRMAGAIALANNLNDDQFVEFVNDLVKGGVADLRENLDLVRTGKVTA